MKKHNYTISNAMNTLTDDARDLVNATSTVAEEKVEEARKRLDATLRQGKEIYDSIRETTVESVEALEKTARKHPYQAIAIGIGIGALIGYLFAHITRQSS